MNNQSKWSLEEVTKALDEINTEPLVSKEFKMAWRKSIFEQAGWDEDEFLVTITVM